MNIVYKLSLGRLGGFIELFSLSEDGEIESQWTANFNARAVQFIRQKCITNKGGTFSYYENDVLLDYDSVLNPRDISEGEVQLYDMVNGPFSPFEKDFIYVLSQLSALWESTDNEEIFHNAIKCLLNKYK